MKKIFLVRHCSAVGQHKDSPLTKEGIRQARQLSTFFARQNIEFDKIISSPYLRAIESIKPYAEQINSRIEVNENLRERILSEEPIDDWLDVLEQSFIDLDFALPGGESGNDCIRRANSVLESLYSNNALSNIIIVSHGNLITLLLKYYDNTFGFDHWKRLRNPDVFVITLDNGLKKIECLWDL
ncbi:histidine phosphatase family protein [Virgibacillus dakarensis]|uniref:histidine phosphatase family protein n=1 Tax=Virgibacillus dakarensis TaxID=1917889 RepID=UPI000B42E160|nr:histidine phosphatase family protein [Virgibacillus dakarensis]